jgi:cholesterol oxidase
MEKIYEAVVIGTGFGGAISACRLSKKWPAGKVLILERGRRYPKGSFPRTPHDMARSFWNVSDEPHPRPHNIKHSNGAGLFDIRDYSDLDVVLSAGYGGGSLIYANVFMEPPVEVFDQRWPATCKKEHLQPYYRIVKEVLGSRPMPLNGDSRRRVHRTEVFQRVAKEMGRETKLVDLNVFFGNDFEHPLPIGEQEKNRYGATQTSCTYCAECDIGCNTHSKNTLDLNYLFVAEHRYQAEVHTETLVRKIAPLNAQGQDDPGADGTHGYRVYARSLADDVDRSFVTKRVILSAGTLGTTELLLRCKEVFGTLTRVSPRLGQRLSGNGDFLAFVMRGTEASNPNYGPVITQRIDFNLFKDFDGDRAFILEDASYPHLLAWFVEGMKPGAMHLASIERAVRAWWSRFRKGFRGGSVAYALREVLSRDISYDTNVLLCMGLDRADGEMRLREGWLDVRWNVKSAASLYNAILAAGRDFTAKVNAGAFIPLPTWDPPVKHNVTVHPLGGCVLAESASTGVVSAARATFGQVFNYQGLYVADGSLIPTAVGANPTATISALCEMVAEGITGQTPDPNL